jgi:two-component system, NarL family, invasion response regulator UvrY
VASIHHTDYYYSEKIAKKIFDMHQQNSPLLPKITERQMEFLRYCCSELSYKKMSVRMGVSVRTVEAFRDALFDKFNITTRIGLVIFAFQNGLALIKNDPQSDKE